MFVMARPMHATGAPSRVLRVLLSVEHAEDGVDFELRPSSRYAESGRHLRALALRHGFDMEAIDAGPLRLDQGRPVMELYTWLRRR
jgi:predicted TPR repeat methyltransferase